MMGRKLRILLDAELEVSDEAHNLGMTAHVFAHHLKDSQVWNTAFETLPAGDALPGDLQVAHIEEINEEGESIDVWSHPASPWQRIPVEDEEPEERDHEEPYRGEPDTV